MLDSSSYMLESGEHQDTALPMGKSRTKRKPAGMTAPAKGRKFSHKDFLRFPSSEVDEPADVISNDVSDPLPIPPSEAMQPGLQPNTFSHRTDMPPSPDFHRMKHAAEFFSCLGLLEEAFQLHEQIWKQAKDCFQTPSVRMMEIIAYASSATTSAQVEAVISLMEQEMRRISDTDPRNFLYHLVIVDALSRSPHRAATSTRLSSLRLDLHTVGKMLQGLQNHSQCFGLLLCRYVCRALDSTGCDGDSTRLQDHILHYIPGPFELENGNMKNQCLRDCLLWCDHQLEMARMAQPDLLFSGFEDLDSDHDRDHDHVLQKVGNALFCLFWEYWVEENKSPQQVLGQIERRMGVSAAYVLRVLSELIANTFTHPRSNSTVINITGPHQSPLIQRSRRGTMQLLKLPDVELAKMFLEKFLQNQSLAHGGEYLQAEPMKMTLRLRARTLVENYLENSSFPANRNLRHDPTIAPSLPSSDPSWMAFSNLNRTSKTKEKRAWGDCDNRKSSAESLESHNSLFDETMSAMVAGFWK